MTTKITITNASNAVGPSAVGPGYNDGYPVDSEGRSDAERARLGLPAITGLGGRDRDLTVDTLTAAERSRRGLPDMDARGLNPADGRLDARDPRSVAGRLDVDAEGRTAADRARLGLPALPSSHLNMRSQPGPEPTTLSDAAIRAEAWRLWPTGVPSMVAVDRKDPLQAEIARREFFPGTNGNPTPMRDTLPASVRVSVIPLNRGTDRAPTYVADLARGESCEVWLDAATASISVEELPGVPASR